MAQEIILYRSPIEKMFYDGLLDPVFWEFMFYFIIVIAIIVGVYTVLDIKKRRKFRRRK